VERRRYEECKIAPAPDNDVIVAAVVVALPDTLISTLKFAAMEDWPIDHNAMAALPPDRPWSVQGQPPV
jgi:hypothetical protein